jgi:glycosyltransferase 2 family protein
MKKSAILVCKLLLAAGLLAWVLSQAHWQDYVLAEDGTTWTWLPRVTGGKQYVAESWASMILAGRKEREVRVFMPDEFVVADPGAAKEDWHRRYVRRGFLTSIEQMNLWWFAAAAGAIPLSIMIGGLRLCYLLRVQRVVVPAWELVRLAFLGQFFNMVVPGTVGGDVVKAWYLCKHSPNTAGVLVSMLFDRVIGLVSLLLLSAVMLAMVLSLGQKTVAEMRLALIAVGTVFGLVMLMGLFLYWPGLRRMLHLQRFYDKLRIAHHAEAAGRAVRIFAGKPRVMLLALGISFLAHLFLVCGCAMIGMALHLGVDLLNYFVYLPLIYIIGAIPVTPGGVGVIEKLYVTFFAAPGISASAIIALAMLARLVITFWGLPGLMVMLTGPRRPKVEDMQAEIDQAEHRLDGEK